MSSFVRAVISLSALMLVPNSCFAEYTLNVNFSGTGSGRVVVTNNTLSTQIIDTKVNIAYPNVNDLHNLTAVGTASSIAITATASNVVAGSALNVNSVYTPQSKLTTYSRDNGALNVPVPPDYIDTFDNIFGDPVVSLNYQFDLVDSFTTARQFQYFFGPGAVPALVTLNTGNFYANSDATPVPWTAFSSLGIGANRSGTLRVIDQSIDNSIPIRYSDTSFSFDILPSGGTTAVPEPSAMVLLSFVLGGGAIGRRFWKKRTHA